MSTASPVAANFELIRDAETSLLSRLRLFVRILLRRTNDDSIFLQAAALSYNTLFSLLPTFVLAILVVSLIGGGSGESSLGDQVQRWVLQQLALDQIQVNTSATGPAGQTNIGELIGDRVESVRAVLQTPATGIIGFLTLLWGAVSLMLAIERAFARIYRATKSRKAAERMNLYTTVLVLGPLGAGASIVLSQFVYKVGESVTPLSFLLRPVSFLGSFFVSWLGVSLMYRLVPPVHVRWRSAVIGGLFGASLWELGKLGFGFYVQHAVGFGRFYGNLALVPLFMLWIYCTWNFVLIGLEVTYIHHHFHALLRRLSNNMAAESGLTDLRWVLPLGVILCKRFRDGKVLDLDSALDEMNLPSEVIESLLISLRHAGILHYIESQGYALARPPERITADELLAAARHASKTASNPLDAGPGLQSLRDLESEWTKKTTLADLSA